MERFITIQLLKADLEEIDRQLQNNGFRDMLGVLLVKQAFIAVANLVDFELSVRPLYQAHRELSAEYKKASKEFEFAKYLRNKFIGHIKPELLEKAIEWKPELRYLLKRTGEKEVMFMYNLWILETAINTYVNSDGKHKIFESETDLVYPPDLKRFLDFLSLIVKSGIAFLSLLGETLAKSIEMADPKEQNLEHWLAAGDTQFEFIRK